MCHRLLNFVLKGTRLLFVLSENCLLALLLTVNKRLPVTCISQLVFVRFLPVFYFSHGIGMYDHCSIIPSGLVSNIFSYSYLLSDYFS